MEEQLLVGGLFVLFVIVITYEMWSIAGGKSGRLVEIFQRQRALCGKLLRLRR